MSDNTVEIAVKLALDQFRQAVNQLETAFGGAMSKIEAEGAVAAGALDEAFRTLGVKSVAQTEAEVRKLQTALALIKQMPGVLPADAERATQAFNARVAELRGQLSGVPAAARGAAGAINETAQALGNAAHKALAWAAAISGVGGLTDLAKQVVETGSAFEQLEGRLASLLGSQTAAADAFAEIKELARTTPFEVNALTEAYAKLTAFGLQPSMAQMRAFADTAAALGGGTQMLERVTLALGQAWTKGKLQGQEIMQLAEAGVPVWDLLAQATGKNVGELQRLSESGRLGRDVIKRLIDEMGRVNAGASAKLMDTFAGAVSNAKDAMSEFFDMIASSGVLDYLKGQIQALLAEYERMKETGELEAKAKAVAEAFLNFAEATKIAVEAVSALSGVIKIALELFVAQKVLAFAGALREMALASTLAGAAVETLGTQTKAAGTAAAAAAVQVGLLGRAFALLKGLTVVGLIEGVISLGAEFFRAKRAAEEGERAVAKMLEAKPAPVKDQIRDVVAETHRAKGALTEWQKGFLELQREGKATGDILAELVKRSDLTSVKGVTELVSGLDSIRAMALATGEQIDKSLRAALQNMTGKELAEFRIMAESAFAAGDISARALDATLRTALDVSLKQLGVSAQASLDGMSAKFAESQAHAQNLVASLDILKAAGIDTGVAMNQALDAMLKAAETDKDFATLAATVKQLGEEGLITKKKTDELLDAIRDKSDAAKEGINSVAEAFKVLGVRSDADIQRAIDKLREANDTIQQSGASLREKQAAFAAYANEVLRSGTEMQKAMVLAQAEAKGLAIEVDNAGRATVKLKQEADGIAEKYGKAADEAKRLADKTKETADESERAAQTINRIKAPGAPDDRPEFTLSRQMLQDIADGRLQHAFVTPAMARESLAQSEQMAIEQEIARRKDQEWNDKIRAEVDRRLGVAKSEPTKTVNVNLRLPNGREVTVATTGGTEQNLLDALKAMGMRS